MAELRYRAIGLVIVGVVGAMGCDSGETSGSGGTGGGLDCPEDPALADVPAGCGIWVSAAKGDDANDGTQGAPVATMTHAIELAAQGSRRVYACGGTWTETLVVPSGVSLHAGFDCDNGWLYTGETNRAVIKAPSPTAMTWIGGGNMGKAFMTDFQVEASDATEPGGSSIAVFVRDELPLEIIRCKLVAGNGKHGANGDPGDPNDLPAMAGASGNAGADACQAALSKGGASPESVCSSGTSKGGAGGDSSTMIADSGGAGEPAGEVPGGEGGLGEQVTPSCTAGSPGTDGADGAWGIGGGNGPDDVGRYGRLTSDGYIGVAGTDGEPGMPGQGGGGGGARFGNMVACGGSNSGGAAGGSGGAGGCGGKAGRGGQGGGASIALAVRSSAVRIEYSVLATGNSGFGGDGGAPQLGGAGGAGGKGGKGFGSLQAGCAGGNGGQGGRGGGGGGGRGGAVAPIGILEGVVVSTGPLDMVFGEAGQGGLGHPDGGLYNGGTFGTYAQMVQFGP